MSKKVFITRAISDTGVKLLKEAGFEVEEGITKKNSEYNWAIDPIDGTKNYVAEMPVFVSQLALSYKTKPILGCVFNPVSNQLFSASQGNGTTLNGQKLELHFLTDPQAMVVDIDLGKVDEDEDWKIEVIKRLSHSFFRIRVFGGVYSIYTLTGAVDAEIDINLKVKYVDLAPRIILNREAGFKIEYVQLPNGIQVLIMASPLQFTFISQLLTAK